MISSQLSRAELTFNQTAMPYQLQCFIMFMFNIHVLSCYFFDIQYKYLFDLVGKLYFSSRHLVIYFDRITNVFNLLTLRLLTLVINIMNVLQYFLLASSVSRDG